METGDIVGIPFLNTLSDDSLSSWSTYVEKRMLLVAGGIQPSIK